MFENGFGESLTETQIVTRIQTIAKIHYLKGAFSIKSMQNLLEDTDCSGKQARVVVKNMGKSIDVI